MKYRCPNGYFGSKMEGELYFDILAFYSTHNCAISLSCIREYMSIIPYNFPVYFTMKHRNTFWWGHFKSISTILGKRCKDE